ncbi:hypothetical protein [uncultured Kordia sp.]|uniref:hypothetical protein n=1 Tax=uncultured Kordia sp. TaxID=507699 RepID=UPI0026265F26|nr:hypothetical protein [uncultured Kordia sp.]
MSTKKIAVITKNPSLQKQLSESIEAYNFEVYLINSFPKALTIITKEQVDILLGDFSFNEPSRRAEFAEQLSEHSPQHASFIFFTDNDPDYFLIEDLKITQTYYRIRKPVSSLELQHTINLVLDSA